MEGWRSLQYFASDSLSHLTLDFRLDFRSGLTGDHVHRYVGAVRDACVNFCHLVKGSLRSLAAEINKENEAVLAPAFTEMVQHLPNIRKLRVPLGGTGLSSSFHRLCQLRDLAFLDVKAHPGSFDEVERLHNSIPSKPFKGLRTLRFESTISFYQPIIHSIQSTSLNSLRLVFRELCPLPAESFNSLIQATCCATTSLQVFDLTIHMPSSRRLLSSLPTVAVLLPLFAHRKLQELVIDLGVPIRFTDADIDTIACMWPRLWKLRLISATGFCEGVGSDMKRNDSWKPQATCKAVMALLYHLENLTELAIEFDATSLDELEGNVKSVAERDEFLGLGVSGRTERGRILRTSALKKFDAGRSRPGEALNLACWFAVLCPKLRELQWTGENEGWERASAMLQRIQGRAVV